MRMMMMMMMLVVMVHMPACATLKLCIKGCGGQRISYRGFSPCQSCLTTSISIITAATKPLCNSAASAQSSVLHNPPSLHLFSALFIKRLEKGSKFRSQALSLALIGGGGGGTGTESPTCLYFWSGCMQIFPEHMQIVFQTYTGREDIYALKPV